MQTESKRIRQLRRMLAKSIPRRPNDRATLAQVEALPLTKLLVVYLNWQLGFVRTAPRRVRIALAAKRDCRWWEQKAEIYAFLDKVEAGADLTPHLSTTVHRNGFVAMKSGADRWADKDFLLNVMGFHHFHLGAVAAGSRLAARTDRVLFARVTRTDFDVLGLFDHRVFETCSQSEALNEERRRLWQVFQSCIAADLPARSVGIGGYGGLGITTAGTPALLTRLAMDDARTIQDFDQRLDEQDFQSRLFAPAEVSTRSRFSWELCHLDLCVYEHRTNTRFLLRKGPL